MTRVDTTSTDPKHIPRLHSLDVLRGLAVLLVILYHCTCWVKMPVSCLLDKVWLAFAEWGFAGVDLFFVLSGFLITRNLLISTAGDAYFRNFFYRRALRILPLYVLYLLLVFHACARLVPAYDWSAYKPFEPAFWVFVQNAVIYANHLPGSMFFIHLWSLAVEEQFYLVWPLVVLRSGKWLGAFSAFLIIASQILRYALKDQGNDVMLLTPCRMDALAMGAIIAVLYVSNQRLLNGRNSLIVAAAGFCGFAIYIMLRHCKVSVWGLPQWMPVLAFPSYNLLFAGLVAFSTQPQYLVWVKRVFELPVLILFGKYSYCIYLFHFPLLYFEAQRCFLPLSSYFPNATVFWLSLFLTTSALSLIIGAISWNFFEKHFMAMKNRLPGPFVDGDTGRGAKR